MRNVFLSLLLVPPLFAPLAQKPPDTTTTDFELIKVGHGIYACINRFGGKAICNAGIIDNGESTIIFDTFLSPDAAQEMIRVVAKLKLSPIRYVVNSHYHNDHVRGNQCFSPEVKILSTKRTAELIAREEPKSIAAERLYAPLQYRHYDSLFASYTGDTTAMDFQIIKMDRAYFSELSESYRKVQTRIPDSYVVKEMTLDGNRRKVRLIDEGAGHTESDLILSVPDDSILFAGDLLFNKCHPYLADGSLSGLKRALAKMEQMPVKTVVPGHGNVGGRESIRAMREYIENLEALIGNLKKEGGGKEAVRNLRIPENYRDWWMSDFFPDNTEFVYNTVK